MQEQQDDRPVLDVCVPIVGMCQLLERMIVDVEVRHIAAARFVEPCD